MNSKHRDGHRDITPPIHLSSTHEVTWQEAQRVAEGDEAIPFYQRYGNPTVRAVEDQLLSLCAPPDDAENYAALLTSSGMAAISTALLALLRSGDEIVATDPIYGGTSKLMREMLPRWGITTRFVPCDLRDAEGSITPQTKLLWVESPANPINRIVPFDVAVALAKRHNLISCVDATFAPPPLQSPLSYGFDLEMHAATKYIGGHSDLLAGALVGRRDLMSRIRATHRSLGATLDPHAAWLLGRGLLTLGVRMRQINESAGRVAAWLQAQPGIERVHYAGLESHPDAALARSQMPGGFGGIVAFDLKERSSQAAERLVAGLRLIRHAPSLGGTESLVSYPPLSSHSGQSDAQLAAAGFTRGTLRLAIGLDAAQDLEKDLESALRHL